MGIDKDVAKFLLSANQRKVSFKKTLMLGNQQFQVSPKASGDLAKIFSLKNFSQINSTDEFLSFLGAEEISAMDISSYENASILHDLNKPIGIDLIGKFSLVLDGGTLEHVFNFPVALANAMNLVEIGGHLVIVNGGNNFLGHGFYQFSPELFYRCLSPENGFEIKRFIAAEVGGNWYEVADPKKINSRVELVNNKPTYLLVLAEKIAQKPVFENTPQQSDYVEMWDKKHASDEKVSSSNKLKNILKKSEFLYNTLTQLKQKQLDKALLKEKSFGNHKAFKPVDK